MKQDQHGKPEDEELARARDLLARTVSFLERCSQDPQAALQSEDPRELIRGLEALSLGPPEEENQVQPEPRTIPIRRRRSA